MINDIDINKIVVSNKLPIGKQDFKYFIGYKDSEKIRYICVFRWQMIIYKRNFDENLNRLIYILIKKEKVFVKYMDILEKVRNIIKFMYNLYIIKKNLKAEEKKINIKEAFNVYMHQ